MDIPDKPVILGIDIGSVSIGMAAVTFDKNILHSAYAFHYGDIAGTARRLLSEFDMEAVCAVAATSDTPSIICTDAWYDNTIATIAAARIFHSEIGAILFVGGERFGLLRFDDGNQYAGYTTNTSCAAGTGSFLDQQAGRLNLDGIAELSSVASKNTGQMPKIASRCAVFAKTDLIHAQQEGYTIGEISDGLCRGLARNIVDTLFTHQTVNAPLIFCGGVSRNPAVVNHIRELTELDIRVDALSHLYGAIGAAACLADDAERKITDPVHDRVIVQDPAVEKTYGFAPLTLTLSDYPDFDAVDAYEFSSRGHTVEVDVYAPLSGGTVSDVYLGIDIGSTSTKAVWMTAGREVLAGFYTRTAGRPVDAVCALFAAGDDLVRQSGVSLRFIGAGSTGSGRKLVGRIVGADRVIDEITAHARAAVELNPEVDTIIEIGGQDSKFTTLENGQVTFSIMNTVCAAGTGSFIEEQAAKLGCPLSEYSRRAENRSAPIVSDRCTVFMERDMNYYLGRGYDVDEVLASALHSVRENYLTKVAVESSIGTTVCFQGATAKNRALVAAFEQRLNRPIHVSKYCHLTGALGVALHLADEKVCHSTFRGLSLHRKQIPVRSEVCDICTNHCKLTVADLEDGPVAYGFLCGRDYDTRRFVDNNRSGFDLVRQRRKIFTPPTPKPSGEGATVGIPAALYMMGEMSLWVDFFNRLGIKTVTSKALKDAVPIGKSEVGAEFCAPITALHGHVRYLLDRADYVFLPFYLDEKQKDGEARRQYCYYSQYAPSLAASMDASVRGRILSPKIRYLYNIFHVRLELYRMVQSVASRSISFIEVSLAYERAISDFRDARRKWQEVYQTLRQTDDDVSVMLLGRPYTLLSRDMNKKIPDIFASLGIKTFYQDMIDTDPDDLADIRPFLDELHWNYAADEVKAARIVAQTPGIYPVFVTSFKCAPDSFVRGIIKEIMAAADKPYLILELDEHDSSIGYETRIEAAVRTFRSHHRRSAPAPSADFTGINPVKVPRIADNTLVFPNWDPVTCPLLVASLKREGVNAELMEETQDSIRRSMGLNSGQCIPINAIVYEYVEYIKRHDLDPEKTALWMADAELACNLRLYPYQIKKMLSAFGPAMAKAGVYTGTIAFTDVSLRAAINAYFAFMFGGMLRRLVCRTRPYEIVSGDTDRAMKEAIGILTGAFLGLRSKESAVAEVADLFGGIAVTPHARPKVAIFGDLYVRDNEIFNQDLIRFIEENGGEAVTTPYTDYCKMIAPAYFRKWFAEGKYLEVLITRTLLAAMTHQEKTYYRHFQRVLKEPEPVYDVPAQQILADYGMIAENSGESMDNILKIHYIKKYHPEISLFVQTSPALCCPSLVTEAMARTIEAHIGVPVVSITYDGTGGDKNRKIIPYLKYSPQRSTDRIAGRAVH